MEKEVSQKLKVIDNEISNALSTITDLEEKLTVVRTDDEGHILKDECTALREKFDSFNKSIHELTNMLVELGVITKEDAEDL